MKEKFNGQILLPKGNKVKKPKNNLADVNVSGPI